VSQPAGSADSEVRETTGLDLGAGLGAGTEAFFFDIFLLLYRKQSVMYFFREQK
jgi:hypothetical protein